MIDVVEWWGTNGSVRTFPPDRSTTSFPTTSSTFQSAPFTRMSGIEGADDLIRSLLLEDTNGVNGDQLRDKKCPVAFNNNGAAWPFDLFH